MSIIFTTITSEEEVNQVLDLQQQKSQQEYLRRC
jgi:hypothetical protein